jgi:hypothetical protein
LILKDKINILLLLDSAIREFIGCGYAKEKRVKVESVKERTYNKLIE